MKTWKVIAGLLVVWLVVIVYMSSSLIPLQSSDVNNNDLERQLKRAVREMDKLKSQNEEFKNLITEMQLVYLYLFHW